ncbi:MAG: MBOAT family protein [Pseudomonadota bacterium]
MLFNSLPFLLGFLPVTFAGFFLIGVRSSKLAAAWLGAASLFFYGWWNVEFVSLLLASIVFNFTAGYFISRNGKTMSPRAHFALLTFAVASNLVLLGYYKYANFFGASIAVLIGVPLHMDAILLPLGISFFTFTQIAFLVDAYRGQASEYNFAHYLLFVTYFPHLIAGPILHHKQMIPQFERPETYRISSANISIGLTIFAIGLIKKVLIADRLALVSTPIFSTTLNGGEPALIEAWVGALAYTLQLYFDFSGYSDMAIGLSRMFNVKLPLNFASPYKAVNIIEFWRRWHITLSTFLRDYLYIPLGGNRKGKRRRYINLFLTMLLGGLWHGAAWTFVAWGALHGLYLITNHGFRALRARFGWKTNCYRRLGVFASGLLTFISVVVAWVVFRAETFQSAQVMLNGMFGGAGLSAHKVFAISGLSDNDLVLVILGLLAVFLLPNTQEFMRDFDPAYEKVEAPLRLFAGWHWAPERAWTWLPIAVLFAIALVGMSPHRVSEFLYFQF